MKQTPDIAATTPVIAAALRRRPSTRPRRALHNSAGGRGGENASNNYIAISPLTACEIGQTRNRPGARLGNKHAQKHGFHSAAARAERSRWRAAYRAYVAELKALNRSINAGLDITPHLRVLEARMEEMRTR